jgi:ankyrin repeat protein
MPLVGLLLQHGNTPMHAAAKKGHLEVVQKLLGAGAAVDAAEKVSSPCALNVSKLLLAHWWLKQDAAGLLCIVALEKGGKLK